MGRPAVDVLKQVSRAALVIATAMACGDGSSPGAVDPSTIGVHSKEGIGVYLVDNAGRALYSFSGDSDGQTACLTNCATVWRPVKVSSLPKVADPTIDATKLSLLTRPDSSSQLLYNRIPLYYFDGDAKKGDTGGHTALGFGGRFSLVAPEGKPLPAPR